MTDKLVRYEAARIALREAKEVDEAKDIHDKADAVRAYARQAKDTEMVSWASEIKLRAMRRMGELLAETERQQPGEYQRSRDTTVAPSLSDLGISRDTSSLSQKIAAVPENEFEAHLNELREQHKEVTVAGVASLARKSEIHKRHNEIASDGKFPKGKYRVIYADPPWFYGDSRRGLKNYSGAEDHYPTMKIYELCDLPVINLAHSDAVLFIWVTSPLLAESFKVIEAWGFVYKAAFVWDKIKHNYGHYNSVRHELLLVCTRGSCMPDNSKLYDSVVSIEKTKKHSQKPEEFRSIIDELYPNGPRIELFARGDLPNEWEGWGYESKD